MTAERHGNTEKGALASPLSANTYDLVSHTYDTSAGKYGILTQTVDARGYTTKFDYGPVTSCSSAGTSANPSGAYATQETRAFGQTEQQIWNYGYEPCTGLRTTVTDPNSVITTTGYDSFGRSTSVTQGTVRATYTRYSDANRWVKTCADKDGLGDGKIIAVRHYDGLGQLRLSRQLESGTMTACDSISEDEAVGIKVKRGYHWEAGGHYEVVSNPYINGGESTMGWTLTKFDDSGRVSTVESYAGDALPVAFNGSNSPITGRTSYS